MEVVLTERLYVKGAILGLILGGFCFGTLEAAYSSFLLGVLSTSWVGYYDNLNYKKIIKLYW